MYQGTAVASDTTTKSLLYDWFRFREVNSFDEDKFIHYYKRNINLYYPKYLLLLEDELLDLPELANFKNEITGQLRNYGDIVDVIDRAITHDTTVTNDLTKTTNMDSIENGKIKAKTTENPDTFVRRDDDLSEHIGGNVTHHSEDTGHNTSHSSNETTGDNRVRGLMRQLPQSIEYGGQGQIGFDGDGYPNKFEWSTATNQAEDLTHEHTVAEGDAYGDTSSTTDGYNKEDTTKTNTGNTSSHTYGQNITDKEQEYENLTNHTGGDIKDTGTQRDNGTTTEDTTNTRTLDDKHDMFTTQIGFKDMTEADIRKSIWDYIGNSIALEWFLSKLEVCFIGVFE